MATHAFQHQRSGAAARGAVEAMPRPRRGNGDGRLAGGLGWFSVGFGLAEVSAPGGFVDKFPMGAIVNRALTIRPGQTHVQRYMKPLLERVRKGEIDPSFVITHRVRLEDAPKMYDVFLNKQDECMKVVLKP
jgi:hypothetical protein